jgi:hypothetical protein
MGRCTGGTADDGASGAIVAVVEGTGSAAAATESAAGDACARLEVVAAVEASPFRARRRAERYCDPRGAAKPGTELPAPLAKRPRTATKLRARTRPLGPRRRRTAPTPPDEATGA